MNILVLNDPKIPNHPKFYVRKTVYNLFKTIQINLKKTRCSKMLVIFSRIKTFSLSPIRSTILAGFDLISTAASNILGKLGEIEKL